MTLDQIRADYRSGLGEFEPVVLRRYTGTAANRPFFDVAVQGRVMGYDPKDLVGDIKQGDTRIILLQEDLVAKQFPLPISKETDRAIVKGRELSIQSADDRTRRYQGEIIAWDLQARG